MDDPEAHLCVPRHSSGSVIVRYHTGPTLRICDDATKTTDATRIATRYCPALESCEHERLELDHVIISERTSIQVHAHLDLFTSRFH